ncbi:protein ECERIFERUM 2 [Ziziphus jujuba]|uniref:Protein ECERIFERUM 2 n=1 Tax=Ziziphus jujuba TaxID=326968 RepID=A0A6P4AJI8_ZIZJJ|nr:protein ECERIFERUM 2 [Ziziphus jujuba]
MVSENQLQSPVIGKKLSSVVPAKNRGENEVHELTEMDLAMKLHYIRGLYFFERNAVQGVSVKDLKDALFPLLDNYFTTAGRIRRSETGRPMTKCNDAGVRTVEAYCEKTIDEWLATKGGSCFSDGLCYNQVLGPDLYFSPLVFLQFTWFKCGGLAVGLSWAHILGDPFSASIFINTWGEIMADRFPQMSIRYVSKSQKSKLLNSLIVKKPFSMKQIDPVGDHWLIANYCKMETRSFQITGKDLDRLISTICYGNQTTRASHFDILTAIIWKSLYRIRENLGPTRVTICTSNKDAHKREKEIPNNGMMFSTVEADFLKGVEVDVLELAIMISEKRVDENERIEEMAGRENGKLDFIVYGANLTFVNLEEADIYEVEMKGKKPVFASYSIEGIGDEGVVLVLQGPKYGEEEGCCGRTITMVLPQHELSLIENELGTYWSSIGQDAM